MLKRYDTPLYGMSQHEDGDYILFADHEQAMKEKDEQIIKDRATLIKQLQLAGERIADLKEANSSLAGAAIEKPIYKADLIEQITSLEAAVKDDTRWMREMLEDYRIPYDDHSIGRRIALNTFIVGLREQIAALQLYKDATLGKESERERQIIALTAKIERQHQDFDRMLSKYQEQQEDNSVLREQNSAMNASLVRLRPEVEKYKAFWEWSRRADQQAFERYERHELQQTEPGGE